MTSPGTSEGGEGKALSVGTTTKLFFHAMIFTFFHQLLSGSSLSSGGVVSYPIQGLALPDSRAGLAFQFCNNEYANSPPPQLRRATNKTCSTEKAIPGDASPPNGLAVIIFPQRDTKWNAFPP